MRLIAGSRIEVVSNGPRASRNSIAPASPREIHAGDDLVIRILLTLVLTVAWTSSVRATLVITEVMPQTTAGTPGPINGDWWELTNAGSTAINLAGYHWADTEDALGGPTPQPNFFPSVVIHPGQSIIILEENSGNEAAWRTNWGISEFVTILSTSEMIPSPGVTDTFSGLGANGDAVFVYDPSGNLLSQYLYGATTRGVTFEADPSGLDLGLSVIGEHFAVRAGNRDIGSPGRSVVPEPQSLTLLGIACVCLVIPMRARRRKRAAMV
jgi:hypothetical protein